MKYTHKEVSRDKDKVEYEVTVEYKELEPFKESVYKELSKGVKLDGFRPGKAPREKIEAAIGSKLITEAIGRLLPMVAYEVMQKEEDRPVHAPEYDLKDVDEEKGIKFNFAFVNYPEVKLGDFTKIKVKKDIEKVTDADLETVIKSIIRSSVAPEKIRELSKVTEMEKGKNLKKKDDSKKEEPKEKVIDDFELNDDLVKELGYETEKTLEELKKAVRARLEQMKEEQAENEYNSKVLEEAIKLSKFEIPEMFLHNEMHIYEHQFMDRLKELKLDADTYLATQGSSMEKKKEEWEKQAKDKISIDLVLITLANENDSVATNEEVEKEIESIENPEVKKQYQSDSAKEYVRTVITRQRGMLKLLEIVEGKVNAKGKGKSKDKKEDKK